LHILEVLEMNDLMVTNKLVDNAAKIRSMIYEINDVQVMIDSSKLSVTECRGNLYDKIITHFDIGLPISLLINFKDASIELERN